MVGRTPEYLKKKIQAREIKLASLYILTTPTLVLVGTGSPLQWPASVASIANPGAHGSARCSMHSPRPVTTTAPLSPG